MYLVIPSVEDYVEKTDSSDNRSLIITSIDNNDDYDIIATPIDSVASNSAIINSVDKNKKILKKIR